MQNFFYNDKFYSDLGDLCSDLDLDDDDAIKALPDDWSIEATESSEEKISKITPELIANAIDEDRWPEESDSMYRDVIKILKTIDYDAINAVMPELYYETKKTFIITKADLLEDSPVSMKKGDYVYYTPGAGHRQNGRIKSIIADTAFVVYKCNDEWDKYEEYTGCGTDLICLSRGWIDGDEPKSTT